MLFPHERVKVLAAATVAGPYGGTVANWADPTVVSTEPANVQPAAVTEDVAGQQRVEARFDVRVRPDVQVTETNRVRWDRGDGAGERDYEIVAVKPWRHGPPGLRHTHLIIERVQEGG